MTNVASRLRHSGANNFPLQYDTDMQVSFVVVANLPARYNIPLPMRKFKMEVKVISENKIFELNTLARGISEEDDLQYWSERLLSNYILNSEKGGNNGVAPLDSNGLIPPEYLGNIFVNNTYIVADASERLGLTTVTGDYVIQSDDGSTWLKLNNDDPAGFEDFAQISPSGSVLSVNNQTGVVNIDFNALLSYGSSQTQFNTALESSSFAFNVNSTLGTLQTQIDAIDYYTPEEVDSLLNLKANKSNVMPLDGSLVFSPTLDNHPANKKYVDDLIETAGLGVVILVGELFIVENTTGQTIGTTYTKLTQFTKAGTSLGTTSSLTNSNIQVSKTGYYTVMATLSLSSVVSAPTQVVATVYIDGTATDIRSQHIFESTSETEDFTLRGTVNIPIGGLVDLRLKTDNATGVSIKAVYGSLTVTATVAGAEASIKDNLGSTLAPTSNNDGTEGYTVGSHWIDISNDIVYVCTDASTGAAVWKLVSSSNYTHNQITLSTSWSINHGLNKYPSVSVVDSGNNIVVGDVKYTDLNNLTVTFNSSFSGKAYLN